MTHWRTYHDVSAFPFALLLGASIGTVHHDSRLLVYSCTMYSTGPGIVNALFSQLILFLMTVDTNAAGSRL